MQGQIAVCKEQFFRQINSVQFETPQKPSAIVLIDQKIIVVIVLVYITACKFVINCNSCARKDYIKFITIVSIYAKKIVVSQLS
jgi:hypothetical protein